MQLEWDQTINHQLNFRFRCSLWLYVQFALNYVLLWCIISSGFLFLFKHSALCTFKVLVGCSTLTDRIIARFELPSCSSDGIATCRDCLVNQWLHWKTRRLTKAFLALLKLPSFCFCNYWFWCKWVGKSQCPLKTHTLLLCPGRRIGDSIHHISQWNRRITLMCPLKSLGCKT